MIPRGRFNLLSVLTSLNIQLKNKLKLILHLFYLIFCTWESTLVLKKNLVQKLKIFYEVFTVVILDQDFWSVYVSL